MMVGAFAWRGGAWARWRWWVGLCGLQTVLFGALLRGELVMRTARTWWVPINFVDFYTAAVQARAGTLYSVAGYPVLAESLVGMPRWGVPYLYFPQTPYTAVLLEPLVGLGWLGAYLVWVGMAVCGLAAGAWLAGSGVERSWRLAGVWLSLCSVFGLSTLVWGGDVWLEVLGTGLVWQGRRCGRAGVLSCGLFAAMAKPQLGMWLALLVVLDWRRFSGTRLGWWLAGAGALWLAVPVVVTGRWDVWVRMWAAVRGLPHGAWGDQVTVGGLLYLMAGGSVWLWRVVALVCGGGAIGWIGRVGRARGAAWECTWCLQLAVGVVFAAYGHVEDSAVLVGPVMAALAGSGERFEALSDRAQGFLALWLLGGWCVWFLDMSASWTVNADWLVVLPLVVVWYMGVVWRSSWRGAGGGR